MESLQTKFVKTDIHNFLTVQFLFFLKPKRIYYENITI